MSAVIVGVDGSDESMDALQFAATEARLRRVPLRVVHAFTILATDLWTAGIVMDPEPFQRNARQLVDGALTAVGSDLEGIEVEPIVELGGAVTVILEHLSNDDLVVVGSRGRGGFKGLLLGSVSQQLVLHAPCPVVVVRHGSES